MICLYVDFSLVPDLQCNSVPLSKNGTISVSWNFVHTGGLNLSLVSVFHSTDIVPWDFKPVPHEQIVLDEKRRPTSLVVSELLAGNTYVFMVCAFNMLGNSSVMCPPVTHDIGKCMNMNFIKCE